MKAEQARSVVHEPHQQELSGDPYAMESTNTTTTNDNQAAVNLVLQSHSTDAMASVPSNENEISMPPQGDMYSIQDDSERNSYCGFAYRNHRGTTSGADDEIEIARLIRRDLPFSQSRNRVNVGHNHGLKILQLIRHDWFHVMLRYPKTLCLLALLSIWTLVVTLFAVIYIAVDNRQPDVDCGLGKGTVKLLEAIDWAFCLDMNRYKQSTFIHLLSNRFYPLCSSVSFRSSSSSLQHYCNTIVGLPIQFGQSFAFSLETTTTGTMRLIFPLLCSTHTQLNFMDSSTDKLICVILFSPPSYAVGYGLPNGSNAFFENCPELQVVIYFQMVLSMMFNAFLFAFFYSQVASADNRGAQVLLSNKAIISIVDGQVRFQLRVFDIDASNPIVNPHVRLYVVMKARPVPRPLRLLKPNDEFGGKVFLSFPTVVAHHIDIYSLLHPPRLAPINPSGLQLRQIDSHIANREEYTCPICGEGFVSTKQLNDHIAYYVAIETDEGYPVTGTHLSIPKSEYKQETSTGKFDATTDIDELQDYFLHEISEVVCVVEGIEPISSGSFAGVSMRLVLYFNYIFYCPKLLCLTIKLGCRLCILSDALVHV
jgi:hypothetical protein